MLGVYTTTDARMELWWDSNLSLNGTMVDHCVCQRVYFRGHA